MVPEENQRLQGSGRRRWFLVGDIGGTHARFALCDSADLSLSGFVKHQTGEFPTLEAAINDYLGGCSLVPTGACLAIAAPVDRDVVSLTNAHWSFSRESISATTGIGEILLVNDFEAQALALPLLGAADLAPICTGALLPHAPKVVVGPGTGFGMASLVRSGPRREAIAGEGGHITFGATNETEYSILNAIARETGHVSIERVLSGSGIERIHKALGEASGGQFVNRSAPEIVRLAEEEGDALSRRALDIFVSVLARVAGDIALALGARGGVYLAGGIPPRILKTLRSGVFEKAFRNKGRLSNYLADIPVNVVTAPDAGLRGAAAAFVTADHSQQPDQGTAVPR